MTLVITHPYVSSVTETTPSGGPGGNVGPSEWNANHTLTGLVSPAQGGTGITSGTGVTFFSSATVIADSGTLTANALVVGGGANGAPATLASLGTTSTILHGNASGNPSFGAVNLGSEVAGTLPSSFVTLGGANTNVQFNNNSILGGDSGFTYAGNGQITVALGTITTNKMALNITGTLNSSSITFDAPIFANITNTLSAANSAIIDVQQSGIPNLMLFNRTANAISPTLTLGSSATATQIVVYNTVDTLNNPTNYERGIFDWTVSSNILTIGTQAGGTGTNRIIHMTSGQITTEGITFVISGSNILTIGGSSNAGVQIAGTTQAIGFTNNSNSANTTTDIGFFRVTAGVLEFTLTPASPVGNPTGWFQWGGQGRVSSNVTSTTTSLVNITGLSFNLQANRTYSFETQIIGTCSSSGGVQLSVQGSSSGGSVIQVDGYAVDTGPTLRGYSQQTTFGSVVIGTTITGTAFHASLWGTVTTTSSAVNLTVQASQQNLSATQTIIKTGSYMWVYDMP